MINMPGKNEFNGLFNPFEWSAPVYETPEEILNGFRAFGISEKKVVDVRAIGGTYGLKLLRMKDELFYHFRNTGVPDASLSRVKNFNKYRVDNVAYLSEPVVFTFDDGSTFEFAAYVGGQIRMSVNAIPAHIENGLNNSNINLKQMIPQGYFGSKLGELRIAIDQERKIYHSSEKEDDYSDYATADGPHYKWHEGNQLSEWLSSKTFRYTWRSDEHDVVIKAGYSLGFSFYVPSRWSDAPEKIEVAKLVKARKKVNQLFLHRGKGYDATYFIEPYYENYTSLNKIDKFISRNFNITASENIFGLLIDFDILDRYFDKSVNKRRWRDNDGFEKEGFNDYGSNKYTLDTLKKMIASMRIENDKMYSWPLDDLLWLKNYYFDYIGYSHDWCNDVNKSEHDEIIGPYFLNLVCDFRERFCSYMEGFIKVSNLKGISIVGP